MSSSIRTQALRRVYRAKPREGGERAEVTALAGVDLEVSAGECFGLLGPNGAGKTTLIKILTTLLSPTSGRAFVAGVDVAADPEGARRHFNMVSGGEASGYGMLTVEENLWMFSQFYGIPSREAKRRIFEMLEVVGLADRARTKIYHLSTGMRQKMNFARGFITDPEILFLDEPTLGLDVPTARTLRAYLAEWIRRRPDRTILLTTHTMQEADELCGRVAIIDRGRILECDAPAALKRGLSRNPLFRMRVEGLADPEGVLRGVPGVVRSSCAASDGQAEISFALELAAIFVLTMTALYGMGMMFASFFLLFGRGAWRAADLFQEPIYLVSGFYFPVSGLGFWTATCASIVPITLGLDALRQLLFPPMADQAFLPVGTEIAALLALALLFLWGAGRALRYMERRGREEGRLTVRGL